MPTPAYLSTDVFRSRIGAPSTATVSDAVLNIYLCEAEASIAQFLGYDPNASSSVTWILDAAGLPELPLPGPLATVTNVWEDYLANGQSANFGTDDLLTVGTDYMLNQTGTALIRLNAVWPSQWDRYLTRLANSLGPCPGCVKVTGTQSLTAVLNVATMCGYSEAAATYRMSPYGAMMPVSESWAGWAISLSARPAPAGLNTSSPFAAPDVYGKLKRFKRTAMAGVV